PATPFSRANRLDAWSRVVAIEEDSFVQRRTLDALGRLASIVDPLGHTVLSSVFDLADNRIRIDSADCGRSVAVFDAGGNEVRRADADGRVVFYERGSCGRIEAVRADGPQGTTRERMTYDVGWGTNLDGRLSKVEGDFGTAEYSYNATGDPIQVR